MATELKELAKLADQLFEAQTKAAELTADLQVQNKIVQRLAEFDIPEAMEDVGVDSLTTNTGLVIKVDDKLHAKKLTQAHGKALDWLREHDQGGLIKTLVGIPFTAGSESDADELVDRLSGEGIMAAKSCEVHHSSLAATLRKMLEDGEEIPLELLGAYQRRVATVKPAKKR